MPDEVLAANQAFYDAFRDEDPRAMEALWAEQAPCACIHPGWGALIGRERVLASWRAIFSSGAPSIRCEAARVHRLGDDAAFVTCHEVVQGGRLVATNVFVREDGRWRMVHHHAGPSGPVAPDEVELDDDEDSGGSEPPRTIN